MNIFLLPAFCQMMALPSLSIAWPTKVKALPSLVERTRLEMKVIVCCIPHHLFGLLAERNMCH
jgi:hypothetical protein